jgi:hypothetical protein
VVAKTAALGAALVAAVAILAGVLWGGRAAFAAAALGLAAGMLQTAAVALLQPHVRAPAGPFMKRWMLGMGLRLLGVVVVGVAIWADRGIFPPIPSASGFLVVMVPLLFFEARLIR